ncbi:hypothetical protein ABZ470_26660 [Streptosporangium sp. NPDC020072]|uniref:hypothetical protein n=1 Tax=Streptosporangium sp. NPDC020072 TaxID=3154788 RepID=UPI00343B3CEA
MITAKAQLRGWAVKTDQVGNDGTIELTLARDDWTIYVAIQVEKAFAAAIKRPGHSHPAVLPLSSVSRYLQSHREQMAAFRCGQRVVVGDKPGVVEDIVPDETTVRLVVRYDDGSAGEPYTTHVRAEGKRTK